MALILLVEDDEEVRALAGSILEDNGHKILSARTVEHALAAIQAHPIELLFTDIGLGQDEAAGMLQPGLQLAERALSARPGLRVLYTAGHGITEAMKASFVPGSDFLTKPYDLNRLAQKVAELVSR